MGLGRLETEISRRKLYFLGQLNTSLQEMICTSVDKMEVEI